MTCSSPVMRPKYRTHKERSAKADEEGWVGGGGKLKEKKTNQPEMKICNKMVWSKHSHADKEFIYFQSVFWLHSVALLRVRCFFFFFFCGAVDSCFIVIALRNLFPSDFFCARNALQEEFGIQLDLFAGLREADF